mmetsp:Transcript_7829/g.12962  ORF Transcript_7829/g.12962 Transcript_7829/m.12962 type:complete len:485 (+) Transcript_7829:45-1499(+)
MNHFRRMTMMRHRSLLLLLLQLFLLHAQGQQDSLSSTDRNLRGDVVSIEQKERKLRSNLDARWKSTKLTTEQKVAMGIFPPEGYTYPVTDTGGGDIPPAQPEGTLTIVDTVEGEAQVDQVMDITANTMTAAARAKNRRLFIRYEPSKWETGWVDHIEDMVTHKSICKTLLNGKHQTENLHKYLELLCTRQLEGPYEGWCYYHDHNHFMWYNSKNKNMFEVFIDKTPLMLEGIDPPPPQPLVFGEGAELIASKFVFLDEVTGQIYEEYIEPLVGTLRFPLAECVKKRPLLADLASFVIPPPSLSRVEGRTILYDVGSSDWSRMEHIVETWSANDASFQWLISYAPNGNEAQDAFLKTVPEAHKSKIFRHYFPLTSAPTKAKTELFLPKKIKDETAPNDYVMLKLDRVVPANLKQQYVQYILDDKSDHIHVDELFWEINAAGNYVLQQYFDANLQADQLASDMTLPDAYYMLQALRKKGIRAHAWI